MRSKKQIARGEQELTSIKKGKEFGTAERAAALAADRIAPPVARRNESQLSLLAEQTRRERQHGRRAQRPAGTLPRPICGDGTRSLPQLQAEQLPDLYLRLEGFRRRGASHRQHPRRVAKLREAKLREIAETAQEVGRQQELLAAQQQALDSTRRKIDAQRARYERDQRNAKARLQRMSARAKRP